MYIKYCRNSGSFALKYKLQQVRHFRTTVVQTYSAAYINYCECHFPFHFFLLRIMSLLSIALGLLWMSSYTSQISGHWYKALSWFFFMWSFGLTIAHPFVEITQDRANKKQWVGKWKHTLKYFLVLNSFDLKQIYLNGKVGNCFLNNFVTCTYCKCNAKGEDQFAANTKMK